MGLGSSLVPTLTLTRAKTSARTATPQSPKLPRRTCHTYRPIVENLLHLSRLSPIWPHLPNPPPPPGLKAPTCCCRRPNKNSPNLPLLVDDNLFSRIRRRKTDIL